MALGMGFDEFWTCHPSRYKFYREAHKLKTEMRNQEMWLQGLYIHNAVSVSIHNAFSKTPQKYMEKPLRLTPLTEEEKKAEEDKKREEFINYLTTIQKNWEKRNGRRNEGHITSNS